MSKYLLINDKNNFATNSELCKCYGALLTFKNFYNLYFFHTTQFIDTLGKTTMVNEMNCLTSMPMANCIKTLKSVPVLTFDNEPLLL
jgi:hypothetical protein